MSENVREQRSESRERRRSLAAEQFEDLDSKARAQDDEESGSQDGGSVKRAAGAAAAAVVIGGLAGAAKAFLDRRGNAAETDDTDGDDEDEPTAEAQRDPEAERDDDEQTPESSGDDVGDDEREDDSAQPASEAEPGDDDEEEEPEARQDPRADSENDVEDDDPPQPTDVDEDEPTAEQEGKGESSGSAPAQGISQDDIAAIVGHARSSIEELVGMEPESVSSVKRRDGSWAVTLEVVEVRRIPDSTDVLSSYELVVDDDGGIVELNRKRRYRRSQVEES